MSDDCSFQIRPKYNLIVSRANFLFLKTDCSVLFQGPDSCACKAIFGHWSYHDKNRLGRAICVAGYKKSILTTADDKKA